MLQLIVFFHDERVFPRWTCFSTMNVFFHDYSVLSWPECFSTMKVFLTLQKYFVTGFFPITMCFAILLSFCHLNIHILSLLFSYRYYPYLSHPVSIICFQDWYSAIVHQWKLTIGSSYAQQRRLFNKDILFIFLVCMGRRQVETL